MVCSIERTGGLTYGFERAGMNFAREAELNENNAAFWAIVSRLPPADAAAISLGRTSSLPEATNASNALCRGIAGTGITATGKDSILTSQPTPQMTRMLNPIPTTAAKEIPMRATRLFIRRTVELDTKTPCWLRTALRAGA